MDDRALAIAEELLALPTVPFVEDLPARYVTDLASRTAGLSARRDAAGNVLVSAGPAVGRDAGRPLVLVAHLDHPGFSVDAVSGRRVTLSFHGGLALAAAVTGSPVDFFRAGNADPIGRGSLTEVGGDDGRLHRATATIEDGDAHPGGFATWGFSGYELVDGRIVARACDDLLGAAAALATLEAIAGDDLPSPVLGLFTRAEEVGFLGALEAIRLGTVPRHALVLSLECSKALPDAPQGDGVIVRVGDRMSVFDPVLTEALRAAAVAAGVRHQRKLMDGGACEATAFAAAGFRASGLAVALGNYHNAADDGSGVDAEHVLADDYLAEVALLRALASTPFDADPTGPPQWFVERAARAADALGAGD